MPFGFFSVTLRRKAARRQFERTMAEENNNIEPQIEQVRYDDENIRHLSDMEHVRTAGDRIEVNIDENLRVSVRDYGRGIPQGKLIEAVSVLNTGGKYDSKAFKKSVGLNGVGVKAVNALSAHFEVHSYREGKVRKAVFARGEMLSDVTEDTQDENGTYIFFRTAHTSSSSPMTPCS